MTLEDNGLKAFIPSYRLLKRGLVKDIDEDISEEEIQEFLIGKVLKVKKLNKRNRINKRAILNGSLVDRL